MSEKYSKQTCVKLQIFESAQDIFHNFICIVLEHSNFIGALFFQSLNQSGNRKKHNIPYYALKYVKPESNPGSTHRFQLSQYDATQRNLKTPDYYV
jgi:hypothetical protein